MTKSIAPLALAFLCCAAGCADDNDPGNLTISYALGFNEQTCEAAGVVNVRANLNEISQIDPCSDTGDMLVSGVPARTYNDFLVEGVDAEGITIFDSLDMSNPQSVTVHSGASQVVDTVLTATPAKISVVLALFDENMNPYLGTDTSPVTAVEVIALRGGGSSLHSHEFIVAESSNPLIVPDEGRAIAGDLVNGVRINYTANNADLTVMVDGAASFSFDPPGHGRLVELRVECLGEVCTGMLLGTDMGALDAGEETGGGGSGGTG
jgi:hypothetical protein